MKYNPEIKHRRSIRLKEYDYSQAGAYFVTICTQNRECYLGSIVDGALKMTSAGNIAGSCLMIIPSHFKYVELDVFVVMPNHIHAIIVINNNNNRRGVACNIPTLGQRKEIVLEIKGGYMRALVLFVIVVVFLAACATQDAIRNELMENVKQYNDMLRWHKLDTAGIFAIDSLTEEFRARVESAKNINVVECRIIGVKYDEIKNEADVQVEIDYYNISSVTLKTLKDIQKWAYTEEAGSKQWRLKSLLPEFK